MHRSLPLSLFLLRFRCPRAAIFPSLGGIGPATSHKTNFRIMLLRKMGRNLGPKVSPVAIVLTQRLPISADFETVGREGSAATREGVRICRSRLPLVPPAQRLKMLDNGHASVVTARRYLAAMQTRHHGSFEGHFEIILEFAPTDWSLATDLKTRIGGTCHALDSMWATMSGATIDATPRCRLRPGEPSSIAEPPPAAPSRRAHR